MTVTVVTGTGLSPRQTGTIRRKIAYEFVIWELAAVSTNPRSELLLPLILAFINAYFGILSLNH